MPYQSWLIVFANNFEVFKIVLLLNLVFSYKRLCIVIILKRKKIVEHVMWSIGQQADIFSFNIILKFSFEFSTVMIQNFKSFNVNCSYNLNYCAYQLLNILVLFILFLRVVKSSCSDIKLAFHRLILINEQ